MEIVGRIANSGYAQVIKTAPRRRLVRVRHRVVFGALEAVQQVCAACRWQSNTAREVLLFRVPPWP